MRQVNILVIEDDILLGEILSDLLMTHGHTAEHFVRARVQDGEILLTDRDGDETRLDAQRFDLAFLDGNLGRLSLSGPQLTPHLVKVELPVVAMSGADSVNEDMVGLGARAAVVKTSLPAKIREHDGDVLRLLRN